MTIDDEMAEIMSRWCRGFEEMLDTRPRTIMASRLDLEKCMVVNQARGIFFTPIKVTRYVDEETGGLVETTEPCGDQCMRQLGLVLPCGSVSGKPFAGALVRNGLAVATMFSRRDVHWKRISVSGLSHTSLFVNTAFDFFHMIRSIMPPPLPRIGRHADLPPPTRDNPDVFYDVTDVRMLHINQVMSVKFANASIFVDGLKADPSVWRVAYQAGRLGCAVYPRPLVFDPERAEECATTLGSGRESHSCCCFFDGGQIIVLGSRAPIFITIPHLVEIFRHNLRPSDKARKLSTPHKRPGKK
jgi:hypothetical protein